jgi:hypothetical protein
MLRPKVFFCGIALNAAQFIKLNRKICRLFILALTHLNLRSRPVDLNAKADLTSMLINSYFSTKTLLP